MGFYASAAFMDVSSCGFMLVNLAAKPDCRLKQEMGFN